MPRKTTFSALKEPSIDKQSLNQASKSSKDRIFLYSEMLGRQEWVRKHVPNFKGYFAYEIAQKLGIEDNKTKGTDLVKKWIGRIIRKIYANITDVDFFNLMHEGVSKRLSQIAFDEIDMLTRRAKPQHAIRIYDDQGFITDVVRHRDGFLEGQPVYYDNKEALSTENYIQSRIELDYSLSQSYEFKAHDLIYESDRSENTCFHKLETLILNPSPQTEQSIQQEQEAEIIELPVTRPGILTYNKSTILNANEINTPSDFSNALATEVVEEVAIVQQQLKESVQALTSRWDNFGDAYRDKCKALGQAIASQGEQIILEEIATSQRELQKKILDIMPT